MKIKTIYYKKLFPLGIYGNEEIGVEVEVEEGEEASKCFKRAKKFVNKCGKQKQTELSSEELFNFEKQIKDEDENEKKDDLPF